MRVQSNTVYYSNLSLFQQGVPLTQDGLRFIIIHMSPLKVEFQVEDWGPFFRFLARSAIIIGVLGANASTFDATEWIAWGQTVLGLGGVDYFMRRGKSNIE